jgi:hypothetical protein
LVCAYRRAKPRFLGWLCGFKQPPPCQVIRQVRRPHPIKVRHPSLQPADITVDVLDVVFLANHSLIIECDQSMMSNAMVGREGFIPAVPGWTFCGGFLRCLPWQRLTIAVPEATGGLKAQ